MKYNYSIKNNTFILDNLFGAGILYDAPRKKEESFIIKSYLQSVRNLFLEKVAQLVKSDKQIAKSEKEQLHNLLNVLVEAKNVLEEEKRK